MAAFLSVDEPRHVLYLQFAGDLPDVVLLRRYRQALEWNSVHGYLLGIADFSGIVSSNVNSQTIREIAELAPVVPNLPGRMVIIVAPKDFMFGLARMFEMFGHKTRNEIHVVHSIAEAYQLLGVESLDLHPVLEW